ncbi:MAG: tyrosine-type recombinase/integrase, partial [Pseudomonadales bacterium]
TMNTGCYEAIQKLLEHLDRKALKARDLSWVDDDAYLFAGRQPDRAISVPTLNNLVKDWCRKVNLKGNYGSHTLRKTWGYMQRTKQDTPIPLLMQAFGHASQQQTLSYLGIQPEEIELIYTSLAL